MKFFRRLIPNKDLPQTRLYPHDRAVWSWQFPADTWLQRRLEKIRQQRKIAGERI